MLVGRGLRGPTYEKEDPFAKGFTGLLAVMLYLAARAWIFNFIYRPVPKETYISHLSSAP